MEKLLTSEETAQVLGVSDNALRIWRSRGKGPRAYKYGRRVMYRREDLEAWLETKALEMEAAR